MNSTEQMFGFSFGFLTLIDPTEEKALCGSKTKMECLVLCVVMAGMKMRLLWSASSWDITMEQSKVVFPHLIHDKFDQTSYQ